jgi:hypothetical protein
MTDVLMLVLTGVNVAIVAYALVIGRLEKAAAQKRLWREQRYRLAEETRRNLKTIAALEKLELNNNAIQNHEVRALIGQLCADETSAADWEFFSFLAKRRPSASTSVIDPAHLLSLARDTARKITAIADRAELAEEADPEASMRTHVKPRVEAVKTRLEELSGAL